MSNCLLSDKDTCISLYWLKYPFYFFQDTKTQKSIDIDDIVSVSIYLFNIIEQNCKCTKLQLSIFNDIIKNIMINSRNNTSITVDLKFTHFKSKISYIFRSQISCKVFKTLSHFNLSIHVCPLIHCGWQHLLVPCYCHDLGWAKHVFGKNCGSCRPYRIVRVSLCQANIISQFWHKFS